MLRLELADSGFEGSVLSEFRGRPLAHGAATRLFDTLLAWCRERGVVKARGGNGRTRPPSGRPCAG